MTLFEFTDKWGVHIHRAEGPPYDHKEKVTCLACIAQLENAMAEWVEKLNVKYQLPEGFWVGHKYSWEE